MSASASGARSGVRIIDWMEPVKAFALMGILLNHLVEAFGQSAWFTNPGADWPAFEWRFAHFFPHTGSVLGSVIVFLGWLGDSAPGVFIVLSGFGLAWAALERGTARVPAGAFWRARVARIFPLYIAVQWGVLALAAILPDVHFTFEDPRTLASFLGLRFNHDLFFYVSPSWWFVWLVLQLYLVFPLLFAALRRFGAPGFLALAVVITVASRAYGLSLGGDRYFWLTGMFAGSRLAEFALGMAAASWLQRDATRLDNSSATRNLMLGGASLWAIGLGASLFLPTVLVSNLLVSAGMTAVCIAVWRAMRGIAPVARALQWIGMVSFGVFLLHQAPLDWLVGMWSSHPFIQRLVLALGVVAGSFVGAWVLELLVERWRRNGARVLAWNSIRVALLAAAALVLLVLCLLEPSITSDFKRSLLALLLGSALLATVAIEWVSRDVVAWLRWPLWAVAMAAFLQLFVLPMGAGMAAAFGGVFFGVSAALVALAGAATPLIALGACASLVVVSLLMEYGLRLLAPLETTRWGEYPALATDQQRIYALKPGIDLRMRYNNYDYRLVTNAQGLAMGAIDEQRPTADTLRVLVLGNAFTMPEGVDYPHSWTYRLQSTLRACAAPRSIEVINAGVTGYSANEKLPQYRELARRFRPDVVIDQFFVTEFLWSTWTADTQLANIGLVDAAPPLARESQLLTRLSRWQQDLRGIASLQVPTWRKSLALSDFHRKTGEGPYSPAAMDAVRNYYSALKRETAAANTPLFVVYVPTAIAVADLDSLDYVSHADLADDIDLDRPRREFSGIVSGLGLQQIDLTATMHAAAAEQPYFARSWHWTAAGHAVAAGQVAGALASSGLVPEVCARSATDAMQGAPSAQSAAR
jgi:peptidoglycan/LPS O-acetylase OafA/YrhL